MASTIDITKPSGPVAYTQDVRDNFSLAKGEIEQLQNADNRNGIMIPAYFYPNNPYSDPTVQNLIDLMNRHHTVPVIVVINQPGITGTGGPGPVWDGNIEAFIRVVKAAGGMAIGYVATGYGARAPADVQADIVGWNALYPLAPLDGLFFDEFPWDPGAGNSLLTLYEGYYAFARESGYEHVTVNPGTNQQEIWYKHPTFDVCLIHENSFYPPEADMKGNFVGGHIDYRWSLNCALVYAQASFDSAQFATLRKHVKWVYVQDATLPNTWNVMSAHIGAMFAALDPAATGTLLLESGGPAAKMTAIPELAWSQKSAKETVLGVQAFDPLGAPMAPVNQQISISTLAAMVLGAWYDRLILDAQTIAAPPDGVYITAGSSVDGSQDGAELGLLSGSGIISGDLSIRSGHGLSGTGDVQVRTGDSDAAYSGSLLIGTGSVPGNTGGLTLSTGYAAADPYGISGPLTFTTGSAGDTAGGMDFICGNANNVGDVTFALGNAAFGAGGTFSVQAGGGAGGASSGAALWVVGGDEIAGFGGDIMMNPGGPSGNILIYNLPTADPMKSGAVWVDPATHILRLSAAAGLMAMPQRRPPPNGARRPPDRPRRGPPRSR